MEATKQCCFSRLFNAALIRASWPKVRLHAALKAVHGAELGSRCQNNVAKLSPDKLGLFERLRNMGTAFWIRRYLTAFVVAAFVIAVAQLMKGNVFEYSITQGLVWGIVSSLVYISVLAYRLRHIRDAPPNDSPGNGDET